MNQALMNVAHRQLILSALRILKSRRFELPAEAPGICGMVNNILSQHNAHSTRLYWREVREEAWKTWPHFSGVSHYPIPNRVEKTPRSAYWFEPRWEGAMGAMRWDLVEHLIQHYSEGLETPV